MWSWLTRNAGPLEALGAVVTALVAIAALVGVKLQIDANDRLQREQAARDSYRGLLSLSIAHPDFAQFDYCGAPEARRSAYESYIEYALYTAEQVLADDPRWRAPMTEHLRPHGAYLCGRPDWSGYTRDVVSLINGLRAELCGSVEPCGE